MNESIESFAKFLQLSTLPVVLISAAGLILLSITNRLGRVVDRSRHLAHEIESTHTPSKEDTRAQLHVLLKRSHVLRLSVAFTTISVVFSSLMIFMLIFSFVTHELFQIIILVFFATSIVCLILSSLFFLIDTSMALKALRLDIEPHLR
jgi:predicted lysophospholipase L1 biosynthesis ABC-type transport system permease subunit